MSLSPILIEPLTIVPPKIIPVFLAKYLESMINLVVISGFKFSLFSLALFRTTESGKVLKNFLRKLTPVPSFADI